MNRFLKTSMTALALVMMVNGANAQFVATKTEMHANPSEIKPVRNQAEYRATLIGTGALSLMESQLAETKASNGKVKEFAMFEVAEQSTLSTILKELGTPKSEMPAVDKAVIEKLKAAPKGPAFDKAYLNAQVKGHTLLRDITESYLKNGSSSSKDPMEMEARHLAMITLQTIKQHLVQAQDMLAMMK